MLTAEDKKVGGSLWMQTYKGGVYDYASAKDSTPIDLRAIVQSLCHTSRFLSHSKFRWTIAEHSLLVAKIGLQLLRSDEEKAFIHPYLLLHDAHEAYVGDMPAPLKKFIKQEYGFDFKELEREADNRIRRDLGLKVAIPVWCTEIIGESDLYALKLERETFMGSNHEWLVDSIMLPSGVDIKVEKDIPPNQMKRKFQNAIVTAIKVHQNVASRF